MCGGTFNSKQELDSHAQQMHSNQANEQEHSITCSKCGFKAKEPEQMEEHKKETVTDPNHSTSGQQM
ncbi:hypothetical protein HYS91_05780 [Candidatus Daviesbacteria bacterium]|nr:hypothetical protein [Candidatus Daviesbacteria bacterium]